MPIFVGISDGSQDEASKPVQNCCKNAKRSEIQEHDFCMVYIPSLQKNGAKAYKSRVPEIRPGTRLLYAAAQKRKIKKN
jgi:hypothetical protein